MHAATGWLDGGMRIVHHEMREIHQVTFLIRQRLVPRCGEAGQPSETPEPLAFFLIDDCH